MATARNLVSSSTPLFPMLLLALGGPGCTAQLGENTGDNHELFADEVDNGLGTNADGLITASYPVGSILRVTATALNMRTGPSTSHSVRVVMPHDVRVSLLTGDPTNGWYNIRYGSTDGWASGRYLAVVSTPDASPDSPADSGGSGTTTSGVDRAIARARAGVGFSYYWGHGSWLADGPTSSNRGYCSGSCPSCSHSGRYGADCSGFVAKAWEVPSSNTSLSSDSHPYSTYNFYNQSLHWSHISRSNIRRGDAMVYRHNGSGHIVLNESGSPWGQHWVYEARGCSSGIQHNLRSFSSSYHTIRRNGF